jgi:tetratricopeptide (TPR) repeat protein
MEAPQRRSAEQEESWMSNWTTRILMPVITLAAIVCGAPGAMAASADDSDDHLELAALTTRTPNVESTDVIPFQVVVNYRLASAPNAFLLLFAFENNDATSTSQSTENLPITAGSGQEVLNIDYPVHSGVHTLTVMVAMFKTQQKLLTWVSTRPFDLAPWPGRAAFDKAMAARLSGDYAGADDYFSQAIQISPDTGSYYYWRGDTRIYLHEYGAAIDDFNRSIDLTPGDRASRVSRGVALLWNGDPQSAISDLSFAIDNSTSSNDRLTAFAHRARATAEATLHQASEAIGDYQAYLAMAPDAPDRSKVERWIADLS